MNFIKFLNDNLTIFPLDIKNLIISHYSANLIKYNIKNNNYKFKPCSRNSRVLFKYHNKYYYGTIIAIIKCPINLNVIENNITLEYDYSTTYKIIGLEYISDYTNKKIKQGYLNLYKDDNIYQYNKYLIKSENVYNLGYWKYNSKLIKAYNYYNSIRIKLYLNKLTYGKIFKNYNIQDLVKNLNKDEQVDFLLNLN